MSLSKVIAQLKESGFSCLVNGKQIMGVRAKLFDEPTRKFQYFDFSVDCLDADNKKYIKENLGNMAKIKLIDKGNMWLTQEEIDGGVVVQEINEIPTINELVSRIIKIKTTL